MRFQKLIAALLILGLAACAGAQPQESVAPVPLATPAAPSEAAAGPASAVTVLRFLPDGRGLISAHADGALFVRRADGMVRQRLAGHTGAVVDLAVSPDGTRVASIGNDKRTLLQALDGSDAVELAETLTRPNTVAFSPDGATLAVAYWEKLELWRMDELAAGPQQIGELPPSIRLARYAPGGTSLVVALANTGLAQPALHFLDPTDGDELRAVTPPAPVEEIVFAPDGTRYALVTDEGVSVWSAESNEPSLRVPLTYVRALALNGTLLTAAQPDDALEITVWDLATGDVLRTQSETVEGRVVAAFAPDGTTAAVGHEDGSVSLLDLP